MNPLRDDDYETFETITILRMFASTREYADDLQRAIVRAIANHPQCKAHDNGLTGRMTFLNAPSTEAMVNVWLGDAATGVHAVRAALDALRKRQPFVNVVMAPIVTSLHDTGAYYGPHAEIRCGVCGLMDGDCFPGTSREWVE